MWIFLFSNIMLIFANSMAKIHILPSEFSNELSLQFAPGIKAGFPSPAQDYRHDTLDFNRDFIRHPEATFYGRVDGDSMMDVGICKGDIAVIDRSIEPQHGDVVVGAIDREFTVKFLDLTHKAEGWIELRAANKKFSPFRIDETTDFRLWGVVIYTIKKWK